jgi:tetratricopeptide (TPR) repeat protein
VTAARALWLCLALLILLRGAFALVPSMWAWGVNVQRFLDPVTGWGLWAAGALTLVPALGRRLTAAALEPVGDFLARSRRGYLAAFAAGALLVFLMRDRVWFVGDFLIRLGNVEANLLAGNYVAAMPLDYVFHSVLLRPFGFGSTGAANLASRTLGAVEAGLLAALAVRFARVLDAKGAMAAVVSGIVFFGGTLTMFTGLGKPASEMCLVVLALATFGVGALRGRHGLLPFTAVMAAALWLHRSSVMLLPVWLLVTALWLRSQPRGRSWSPATWLALLIPSLSAIFALPQILQIARSYDLSHHVQTTDVVRQGGILAAAFSARHLLDLANLLLALAPVAATLLVLLPLGVRDAARRSERAVAVTLWASFLPALLLVQPQQGIFRDWDVFAPAGLACSILTAFLAAEALERPEARRWLAAPLVALAVVSSFQWLAINRSAERGLARVRAYLSEPPGAEPMDRPLVWDFLTSRYIRLQRWPEAADAAAHAAELAPHRRILLMWGIAETMKGDHQAAAHVYRQLLARVPGDPLAWLGLAGAAYRIGDRAEFERALARLRAFGPDSREAREIRRHLAHFPQVWPLASGPW